jgi:hypothetical protein
MASLPFCFRDKSSYSPHTTNIDERYIKIHFTANGVFSRKTVGIGDYVSVKNNSF